MEDNQGWIWAGTWAGGLHLLLEDENGNYNAKEIKHIQTTVDKARNNVWALFQDNESRYWIGTHGGGLLLMNLPDNATNQIGSQNWQPHFSVYTEESSETKNLYSNTVQSILQDRFKNLWIGTTNGLYKVDSKVFSSFDKTDPPSPITFQSFLPSDDSKAVIGETIEDLYEDDQGMVWVGTEDGLSQFNWYSNQFKNFDLLDNHDKIPHTPSFFVDTAKNIWISKQKEGVLKYRIENGTLKKIKDNINDLILGKRVSTIHSPDNRWIYFGTELGITTLDLETRKTIKYPTPPWLRSNIQDLFIQTILVDRKGFIWLGTDEGLFRIDKQTKAYTFFETDKEAPNSISDNSINHIIEDSLGRIWIATYNGLNKIVDTASDELVFVKYFYDKKNPNNSLASNRVLTLKEIDKYLYIGTSTGVCRYNFSNNQFDNFNSSDYNFGIRSIEKGNNNDIWISTSGGIFNFNDKQKSFQVFDKNDGLKNTSYRRTCSFKDADNNIYFAYSNGFTYFNPDDFLSNTIPPPVYITEVEIMSTNGIRLIEGIFKNKIELNHNDYRLSINFVALNYNRADKNQYRYRLVGFEDQWNKARFGVPLIYTKLKPAQYQLEVQAANNDGIWNKKGSFITIIQHPPYWQTWWFRLLSVFLIAAIILFFFFWYTINYRRRNEELQVYNKTLNKEITYRKKVEQQLYDYNEELKQSNKDLEQFAYVTSHDLKEPLRVIASFSSLLSRSYLGKMDEKTIQYINFINQGVRRMYNVTDSLLTYSIVGQKDSIYDSINLNKLVKAKISELPELKEKKNAIIKIGELPEIIGHKEQIGMVFTNLIDNAIKFNTQEQPIVLIEEEKGEDSYWKFSVQDNGIGIEPPYQKQIFGIFKRLHCKNKYEGAGIGLSVCQKIILRHKGLIWLESEFGKGSTFFFTIKKNLNSINI